MDFKKLEADAMAAVHQVISDAEAHEPAIEDAVVSELGRVGAPSSVAAAAGSIIAALLSHFKASQPSAQQSIQVTPPSQTTGGPSSVQTEWPGPRP